MRNAKLGNHFKESLLAESQDATFWSSWFIILCNVSIHLWLRNKLESSVRRMTDKTSEHLEISFHCTEKFRNLVIMHVFIQEPITRRVQLPHIPVTAFSHTDLFLVWIYAWIQIPTETSVTNCNHKHALMLTCRHVHVRPHCFILTEARSCRLELEYFAEKISKNRLVCKNAVAVAYYESCRLLVMGSCMQHLAWPV